MSQLSTQFCVRVAQGVAQGVALSAVLLASTRPAAAACFGGCTVNGLTFSEASTDFEINQITGSGTLIDPYVIEQAVFGLDISLAIQGLTANRKLDRRPGFALSIVAHNQTGTPWRFYDHELQQIQGIASSEDDGLSFAQGQASARPFTSSHYDTADEVTDVRDYVNFLGGSVQPGDSVRFNYLITDTTPTDTFYVRQRPDFRTGEQPPAQAAAPAPDVAKVPAIPVPAVSEPVTARFAPSKTASLTTASPADRSVPEPSTTAALLGGLGVLGSRALKSRALR